MAVGGTAISLLAQFAALQDPRQTAKVLYPPPEILLLVLAATLAGADDFVEIQTWGEERLDFLRRFLPFTNGIPSTRSASPSTPSNTRSRPRPRHPQPWSKPRSSQTKPPRLNRAKSQPRPRAPNCASKPAESTSS